MTDGRQSWLFEFDVKGGHTHVTVRCGRQDHSLGKCGDLVLENAEWARLREAIHRGFLSWAKDDDDSLAPTSVEFRERPALSGWEEDLLRVAGVDPVDRAGGALTVPPEGLSDEAWVAFLRDGGGDGPW